MIKSMTGFGKGEAVYGAKKFRVELRSLNSKQLDLSIKLPGKYRAAEAEVRNIITRELQRGKVDCFISVESAVAETSAHINTEAFKAQQRLHKSAIVNLKARFRARPAQLVGIRLESLGVDMC